MYGYHREKLHVNHFWELKFWISVLLLIHFRRQPYFKSHGVKGMKSVKKKLVVRTPRVVLTLSYEIKCCDSFRRRKFGVFELILIT